MTFDEFKKKVVQDLKHMFPKGVQAELYNVTKNNSTEVTGIMIKSEENPIAPIIYIEAYYNLYKQGMEFEAILKHIYSVWEESHQKSNSWQMESLLNKEKMKQKIMLKLINYKDNEELLKTIPHRKFLDLAVVYYFMLDMGENGIALINHLYCNVLKMNEAELYGCACENYLKQMSVVVESLDNIIANILGCDLEAEWLAGETKKSSEMYIITNRKSSYGAVSILFLNELIKVKYCDILEQDLYILPSSVHEVLVVPIFTEAKEELKSMVYEINRTKVLKEERLSDNVYCYYHKDGVINIV